MWSKKPNTAVSEVLILYINGRITAEVNHFIVFCDYMLSGICKYLNCVLYHVDYYRGPHVRYIVLGFCDM